MPTYDWKCDWCGEVFEAVGQMTQTEKPCTKCKLGVGNRMFSPNRNILIPGYFRMDRGWHLPPGGSEASSPDLNSRVTTAKRPTFKQEFEKNWRAAGGG